MKFLKITAIVFALMLIPGMHVYGQFTDPASSPLSATTVPQAQQVQPADLARMLKVGATGRPLVLQVGSRVMFEQAHIPGSVFAGPGSQASGLQLLERTVASMPKGKLIVIYCGCCPWSHCPNIGPAYKKLHDLGFTNVKALYMAKNFGDDWAAMGYAVERGE